MQLQVQHSSPPEEHFQGSRYPQCHACIGMGPRSMEAVRQAYHCSKEFFHYMGEKSVESENKCGEKDRTQNNCPSLGGHRHKQALREVRQCCSWVHWAGGLKLCSSERLQMALGPTPGSLVKKHSVLKQRHFLMVVGSSAQIIFGLSREVSSQKDPLCLCILCGCFTASSVALLLWRRLLTLAEELQPGWDPTPKSPT